MNQKDGRLTNSSGPQAKGIRDFLDNGLAILNLGKEYTILLHLLNSGIGDNLDAIAREAALSYISDHTNCRNCERRHTSAYVDKASS